MSYEEKINYLTCIDQNSKPIARVSFDAFPANYEFPLQALFFNFKVDVTYEIRTFISNSAGKLLVKSKNQFKLDANQLSSDKYTDTKHTHASTLININTAVVNVVESDIYKFELSLYDSNEQKLSSLITYAIIDQGV